MSTSAHETPGRDEREAPLELVPSRPAPGEPEKVERKDVAFELDGKVYPLTLKTGHPKDMLLLDRITGGRAIEILSDAQNEAGEPEAEMSEVWGATWTICIVATSLRAGNPTWSVDRVYDRVMRIEDFDEDIAWIGGDSEEQMLPPAQAGDENTPARNSSSSADDSSSSSTPTES